MARYTASPFEQAYPVYAAAGLVAGDYAGLEGAGLSIGIVVLALGLLYVGFIFWEMRDMRRMRRWPSDWLWILLVFFGVGVIAGHMARPRTYPFSEPSDRAHLVYGIVEDSSLENYGNRLIVGIKGVYDAQSVFTPLSGMKARVMTDAVEYVPGDVVLFANNLEPIESLDFPGSSQYIRRMRNRGVLYTSQFLRENEIQLVEHESRITDVFSKLRDDVAVIIDHSPLSRGAKGFILAMTTGVKDDLTQDMRDTFSRAGIAHILSVSGMHVGIVAATMWYLLIPLALVVSRKKRMIVVLVGVWLYAALCGMSAPVMRASVMATLLLTAAMLERIGKGFSALCASVVIILLLDPLALNDVGFQLSVVTVGALVLFMRPAQKLYEGQPDTMRYILSLALTSIVAVAGSWHITSYYFHTLPLFFLPLNIIIIPFLPFILFAGFVAVGLSSVGLNASWIYSLINAAYSLVEKMAGFAGAYYIDSLWPHWLGVLLYSALIITVALALYKPASRKFWTAISAVIAVGAVIIMFAMPVDRPKEQLSMGNTFGMLRVRVNNGNKTTTVYPMRGTCSVIKVPGRAKIAAVDCNVAKLMRDGRPIAGCDYVLVGTQYNGSLNELRRKFGDKRIVLSALLSRKREASLSRQCSIAGLPCHIVRNGGEFKVEYAPLR